MSINTVRGNRASATSKRRANKLGTNRRHFSAVVRSCGGRPLRLSFTDRDACVLKEVASAPGTSREWSGEKGNTSDVERSEGEGCAVEKSQSVPCGVFTLHPCRRCFVAARTAVHYGFFCFRRDLRCRRKTRMFRMRGNKYDQIAEAEARN
jgi:hypothetical protein